MDSKLVLPVQGHQLADFIYSLLGQRRTIEKSFRVNHLVVTHDSLINIFELIRQRVSQNESQLVTLKCSFHFESGRVITVFDPESFKTFADLSQEQTLGADLKLTYLVRFSGAEQPEKQDIRIEIFSNYHPTFRRSFSPGPKLAYAIEATNVTWGEDISNHLDKAIGQLTVEDGFSRLLRLMERGIETFWIQIGMAVLIFSVLIAIFATTVPVVIHDLQFKPTKSQLDQLATSFGLDLINKKLDILLRLDAPESPSPSPLYVAAHDPRSYLFLASLIFIASSIWLIRRYGRVRIVACNRYTTTKLQTLLKTRENIKWTVVAALFVGIVAGLVATRLDTFLFGS
jgi:hypothetical protein